MGSEARFAPGRRQPGARRPVSLVLLAAGLFGVSAAVYVAVSLAIFHTPMYVGQPRLAFFDLHVYRSAAGAAWRGGPLYALRVYRGMRFTYPPFAALFFLPTRLVPADIDSALSWAANLAVLIWLSRATLRLCRRTPAAGSPVGAAASWDGWAAALAAAAVMLWSEPVTVTLGYGQVDLIITLLIVLDLARPRDGPARGVGIGLAAAVKLTPLLFIPYLLLSRQRRAAATATSAFVAAGAVGWALLPGDSARYWTHGVFLQAGRTGNTAAPINQSLLGAAGRLVHGHPPGPGWMLVITGVGLLGLVVAVRLARQQEHGLGFAVCAITSLLISPVSWTHHWVLALPAGVVLADWAYRRRAWPLLVSVAAFGVSVFCYLPELAGLGQGLRVSDGEQIVTDPYVVIGLALLICSALASQRRALPTRASSIIADQPAPG